MTGRVLFLFFSFAALLSISSRDVIEKRYHFEEKNSAFRRLTIHQREGTVGAMLNGHVRRFPGCSVIDRLLKWG